MASVVLNVVLFYCSIYVVLFYMYSVPWGLKPGGGGGGEVTPQIDAGLGSVRSELQPSLRCIVSDPGPQKTSKMDLPMTFKCISFFKKSKMRFEHYLLHFRPFLTSKSDLKFDQKSIKNRPGHRPWILQSFELHFFTSK